MLERIHNGRLQRVGTWIAINDQAGSMNMKIKSVLVKITLPSNESFYGNDNYNNSYHRIC